MGDQLDERERTSAMKTRTPGEMQWSSGWPQQKMKAEDREEGEAASEFFTHFAPDDEIWYILRGTDMKCGHSHFLSALLYKRLLEGTLRILSNRVASANRYVHASCQYRRSVWSLMVVISTRAHWLVAEWSFDWCDNWPLENGWLWLLWVSILLLCTKSLWFLHIVGVQWC